jgi:uncharacterized membrane protein YqhA
MIKSLEAFIEKIIWQSRLVIFFAVVASIVSAVVMVFLGCYEVFYVVKSSGGFLSGRESYEVFQRASLTKFVSAIDSFLISTVLLIFGIGLYELFISKLDLAENDQKSSKILVVHNLDQLKEKLAKVIIMVLIVTFFKHAVKFEYTEILHLLYLSLGILFISLSVYFTHGGGGDKKEEDH